MAGIDPQSPCGLYLLGGIPGEPGAFTVTTRQGAALSTAKAHLEKARLYYRVW